MLRSPNGDPTPPAVVFTTSGPAGWTWKAPISGGESSGKPRWSVESPAGVPCADRGAAGQERHRERWAAVVAKRRQAESREAAQHDVSVRAADDPARSAGADQIEGAGDVTWVVAADIAGRAAAGVRGDDRVGQRHRRCVEGIAVIVDSAAPIRCRVAADRAGSHREGAEIEQTATQDGRIAADRAACQTCMVQVVQSASVSPGIARERTSGQICRAVVMIVDSAALVGCRIAVDVTVRQCRDVVVVVQSTASVPRIAADAAIDQCGRGAATLETNAPAVSAGLVPDDRGARQIGRAFNVEAAPERARVGAHGGRIHDKSTAARDGQSAAADEGALGDVAVERGTRHGGRPGVVEGATGDGGIPGNLAIGQVERALILDPAAVAGRRAGGDRRARDRRRDAVVDLEDPPGVIPTDGEQRRARAGDGLHAGRIRQTELALGQGDRRRCAQGEVDLDGAARRIRLPDRPAERPDAAIVGRARHVRRTTLEVAGPPA